MSLIRMLKKRLDSFKYAFQGIRDLISTQANARIHLSFTFIVILSGILLEISYIEWSILVICISMVLAAEAMNTALEYLTDLVAPSYQKLAGKAKDAAAASVLLLAIGSVFVAGFILLPKLVDLFQ